MKKITIILLLCILFLSINAESYSQVSNKKTSYSQEALQISYIGNMGVLITHLNKTVIIDGFHKEYKPPYLFPSETTVLELIHGRYKDYSKPSMILVTHNHKDHFDEEYINGVLAVNKEAIFYASHQVCKNITAVNKKILSYESQAEVLNQNGILLTAFKINHVNPSMHAKVENMAFIIQLNNYKILHVGDTNWDVATLALQQNAIASKQIDVAILPYWMLYGESAVQQYQKLIGAKQIIAAHVPPNFDETQKQEITDRFPNLVIFSEKGQEFNLK